jgi:diacylglycerol kinase (ATP)
MLNTAAETAIDLANGKAYHPLVKIIKDITAGAVLVALTGLGSVTFILYFDHLPEPIISYLEVIKHYAKYAMPPVIIAICAMVVTFSVKKGEDVFKSPAHHLED